MFISDKLIEDKYSLFLLQPGDNVLLNLDVLWHYTDAKKDFINPYYERSKLYRRFMLEKFIIQKKLSTTPQSLMLL